MKYPPECEPTLRVYGYDLTLHMISENALIIGKPNLLNLKMNEIFDAKVSFANGESCNVKGYVIFIKGEVGVIKLIKGIPFKQINSQQSWCRINYPMFDFRFKQVGI